MDYSPSQLNVVIVNPNEVIYEDQAKRVFLPGKMGELAVMPEHTPLYTELVKGTIKIEQSQGGIQETPIEGGVARIRKNTVTILVGFD